ncbi:uncharacterized protein isoform X2 [Leptinotarsa decemlineata]|uniref:uncharacterized protein isoform X2 n=1 Tax=Leptinotarsa decemlineata TaxID=7539 RepID=UPI003D30968B
MYQKCVCFLFLVILAILSCSGFRIDNLAMTDLTKKYPETSDRHSRDVQRPHHRIRHHRLWRTQAAHNRNAKPHIDAIVYPPNEVNYPKPDELKNPPGELNFPPSEPFFWDSPSRLFPSEDDQSRPNTSEVNQYGLAVSETTWPPRSRHLVSKVDSRFTEPRDQTLPRGRPRPSEVSQPGPPVSETDWPRDQSLPKAKPLTSKVISHSIPLASGVNPFGISASEVKQPELLESRVVWSRDQPFPWSRLSSRSRLTSSEVDRQVDPLYDSTSTRSEVNILTTLFPSETLAQIPPTDLLPTLISRSQRSSSKEPRARRAKKKKRKKKASWSSVQKENFLAMAKQAKFVILAIAESKNTNESCSGYFKVIADFKNNTKSYFHLHRKMVTMECDKAKKLQLQKKYLLLLDDGFGLKDYRKSPKESFLHKIRKLDNKSFVVTKPEVTKLTEVQKGNSTNRILLCEVKGRPIPKITWWRKNQVLSSRKSYRIKYQKRKSKLVIRNATSDLMGEYVCRAENLEGEVDYKNITIWMPTSKLCQKKFERLCRNGGTCYSEDSLDELYCSCAEGFTGRWCEFKVPGDTSTYIQPNLYSCQLGLSTKYNCQN